VGIPLRVTVGRKVSEGKVEVVERSTRATQDASIADIAASVGNMLQAASAGVGASARSRVPVKQ
jgi:hypothetical protein